MRCGASVRGRPPGEGRYRGLMLRRSRDEPARLPPPPVDPLAALDRSQVPTRLLGVVDDAVASERRWRSVTATVAPGPLADRLAELGGRVLAGALEIYAIAARVGEVERILAAVAPDDATARYKAARRRQAAGEEVPELEALEARFASSQRMLNVVADAEAQIQVLDARLAAAVARGAELAITADDRGLRAASDDLDALVGELGAIRTALAGFGSPA